MGARLFGLSRDLQHVFLGSFICSSFFAVDLIYQLSVPFLVGCFSNALVHEIGYSGAPPTSMLTFGGPARSFTLKAGFLWLYKLFSFCFFGRKCSSFMICISLSEMVADLGREDDLCFI